MKNHLISISLSFFVGLMSFGCAKPVSETKSETALTQGKPQSTCKALLKLEGICLDAIWEIYPTESTFGSLLVIARSPNSEKLISDFNTALKVTLWMPSMGHGSSPVKVTPLQPGLFRVEKVFFNMRGDWEIRFKTGEDQAAWALEF